MREIEIVRNIITGRMWKIGRVRKLAIIAGVLEEKAPSCADIFQLATRCRKFAISSINRSTDRPQS